MGLEFIPLDDLGDDADAIVARIRFIADEDKAMLDSASDNLAARDEELFPRKDDRSIHRHGSPH